MGGGRRAAAAESALADLPEQRPAAGDARGVPLLQDGDEEVVMAGVAVAADRQEFQQTGPVGIKADLVAQVVARGVDSTSPASAVMQGQSEP
ncbi:hypothetical protein [Streptomyces monashensis]|uniref:Uncharacterized protein n=1 Tax=Streptomyces monashensis TaxID=1678012 RepID=A0A1S2QLP2_9ACTN|nr:hypothetical protein [Streptomyces monashensis]OIK06325.1 hypothetical protein BIV23_07985 [Streptomyces monashensis]